MSVVEIAENLSYTITVSIGGSDVSDYFVSWDFRESLGQKATATLVLLDHLNGVPVIPGRFGPDGGANELHPHNGTDDVKVEVVISACGVPSQYPTFLIGDVDFSPNGLVTVELEDYHALLEPDGVNDDDIRAESGTITNAVAAIEEMTGDVGIDVEMDTDFTDYPINELRRSQGSRLAWIGQLLRPYQAYTQFRGTRMFVELPRYTGSDWALTDYLNITNLSFRETRAGHKNRYRVSRLQPGANRVVGEARGDTLGRNSQTQATISPPCRSVQAYVTKIERGYLTNFTAYDAADNVLGVSGGGLFSSAAPIAKIEFTFAPLTPAFDLSIIDAEFHVYFLGSKGQPVYDTNFSATINQTPEQTYYGIQEEYTAIEDAVWPTKAIAQAAGEAMALENADQRVISSWTSWLNPRVRAGSRVAITFARLRQSATWNVRQVAHSFSLTTATMQIGCTRRRSA